jgi:hypothetical protein
VSALRILPLVLVLSCTSVRPAIVVSADALIATGRTFEAVGGAFFAGCTGDAHPIPEPTCDAWRAFAPKFKVGYSSAVVAWNLAADGTDPSGPDWAKIVGELGGFAELAAAAVGSRDGGAP